MNVRSAPSDTAMLSPRHVELVRRTEVAQQDVLIALRRTATCNPALNNIFFQRCRPGSQALSRADKRENMLFR